MNPALRIQIFYTLPLSAATALLFAFGYWPIAIVTALGVVATLVWMRRAVTRGLEDEALRASDEFDRRNYRST